MAWYFFVGKLDNETKPLKSWNDIVNCVFYHRDWGGRIILVKFFVFIIGGLFWIIDIGN